MGNTNNNTTNNNNNLQKTCQYQDLDGVIQINDDNPQEKYPKMLQKRMSIFFNT